MKSKYVLTGTTGNLVKDMFGRTLALTLATFFALTMVGTVRAQSDCYPSQLLPQYMYRSNENFPSYTYSTIASEPLGAIFMGGRSEEGQNKAFIMKVSYNVNRVQWRRYVTAVNMDTITAMAVSQDSTKLVAVGSQYNGGTWSVETKIIVVKTDDGGHVNNILVIKTGQASDAEFRVYDGGLHYTATGKVFIAFFQVSQNLQDTDDRKDRNHAGRQLVGSYDVATNSLDWLHEQDMLGYSASMVYRNFCAGCGNIIVGGINWVQDGDHFMLSIARLKEDGTYDPNAVWHINQNNENNQVETPFIDHMHLDSSTGEDWLFGTTRSRDPSKKGEYAYIWKMKLDPVTHDPVPNSVYCVKTSDGIKWDGYVSGLRPILDSGELHMTFQKDDENLFYFVFDWTDSDQKAAQIIPKSLDVGEIHTVFVGTNREMTNNGQAMNRWQGYVGMVKKDFQIQTGGSDNRSKDAATLLGLLDLDNCLDPENREINVKFNSLNFDFDQRTQIWRPNQLLGSTTSVQAVVITDAPEMIVTDDWCSQNNPDESTFQDGSVYPMCTNWDNQYYSMPFSPPKVLTPVECTDTVPTWVYTIDATSFTAERDFFKVSIDSGASLIWVKAMTGGPTADTSYDVTITATSPKGTNRTFNVLINVTGCQAVPIIPSTLLDQLYFVQFPMGDYDAPSFTTDPACTLPIIYSNTVTTNTLINDNLGSGKYLSWQSTSDLDINLYTVTISATNSCVNATASYDLEVRSVCDGQLLQIDSSDLKFTSPALTQNIWQPIGTLAWDETDVDREYPAIDCGPLEFELVTQSNTVPDPAVFTLDFPLDPRQLDVYSEDQLKLGTYLLRIKVTLPDWPYNPGAFKDFSVQINDICEELPYSITPSAAPADLTYLAARPAHSTTAMAPFTVVPSYCPITYTFEVTPDPGDITTFTFDSISLVHTIETPDIAKAQVYSVQTRAVTPFGVDTGIGNSFFVTIVDPCIGASLTFDPTMTPSPYDYLLLSPADVRSIPVSKVLSTETLATCPPVVLTIVKDDLTPIDAVIFTHDAVGETLTSASSDELKIGAYPMKVQAKYSGVAYSTFSHDFTVNVISPCLNDATISSNAQTNPPGYTYTGNSPPADFTLTPFTIYPTFCVETFSCLTISGTPDICSIGGVSTFDPATGAFQFATTDMATYAAGDYTLQITSTIGSVSDTATFDLTLLDPCSAATISLTPSPFVDETDDLGAAETTQSWDLATFHTIDTLVDCGSYELEFYINDGSQTPLNPTIFEDRRGAPNSFARKFVDDLSLIGAYEITYRVYLTSYPTTSTEQTTPFTVTINPSCISPATFSASALADQEYFLTDAFLDYIFAPFSVDPAYCAITYTHSVSDPTQGDTVVTFNDVSRTFTFDHTAGLTPLVDPLLTLKDFTVTVSGTAGLITPVTVQATFNLKVLNPCFDPAFVQIDTVPLPINEEYILFDYALAAPYTFTHVPFTVTTYPFQHSFCGGLTYETTFNGAGIDGTSVPMAYTALTNTFEIYSEDYNLIGLRDITVSAELMAYPTISTVFPEFTQILLVDPCIDFLTITVPAQTAPADYYYTASSPELVFETVQFTTFPLECAANTVYSCAITAGSRTDLCSIVEANAVGGNSVGAFDPAIGRFTFNSIDIVSFVPGTYTLEITGSSGSKSASFTVDLVLIDPCLTVDLQLQPSPFVDATYVLYEPAMQQAWMAQNLISPLTQVDCGPITVYFFNNDLTPVNSALFADDRSTDPNNFFRTLQITDESTDGPYPIRYQVYHQNYPGNIATQLFPFTITIVRSCANPQSLFPSTLVDQEYTITDTAKLYTVPPFTYIPTFCDLVYSFSVVATNGQLAISFNSDQTVREFSFFNDNDLSVAGPSQTVYTVTVKAVLGTLSTIEATTSFQLTVKNPCIDPAFVTIDKVPLPVGQAYDLYSFDDSLGFTFVHDPFVVTTQPLVGHSLCGDVHYNFSFEGVLIGVGTRPMQYDTLTRTFDIFSIDLSLVGLRTIEGEGFFKDYTSVTSSLPHVVETIQIFDPCDRPFSLTDPGQDQTRVYSYTAGGIAFSVQPFVLVPSMCDILYECISPSCLMEGLSFTNGRFSLETFDMVANPPGEIEFTVRATAGFLVQVVEQTTIKITLIDPCETITTSFQSRYPIADVRYVLSRPEIAQPFDELFMLDTKVDCGEINFEFVYADGSQIDGTLFSAPKTATDQRVFKVLQQRVIDSVGEYKIKYRATLAKYPMAAPIELEIPFTVVIDPLPSPSVYVFNVIPQWLTTLKDQYIMQGEQLEYFFGENVNFFGKETAVKLRMREASLFSNYDEIKHAYVVDGAAIPDSMLGLHKVTVEATYADPKGQSQFFTRSFYLHVKADPTRGEGGVSAQDGADKKIETILATDWSGATMFEAQVESVERPIPYIADFSQTGILTIGWDRQMEPYQKPKEIPSEQIAVEATIIEKSETLSAGRRLQGGSTPPDADLSTAQEIWFKEQIAEQESEFRRMLILDALQVRVEKDEDSGELSETVTNFSWDVIDFNQDFIWLQISFENPSGINTLDSKDYITVTFWGVEFFKSFTGVEVEFGTKLTWKILRQLGASEADAIDSLENFINSVVVLGLLPMMLILGFGGRLLPTWMFLNSLQLLAHLPMLDAHVPANLHYYLVYYLSLIRLNSKKVGYSVGAWQKQRGVENYRLITGDDTFYSSLHNMCGYKHTFSRNMILAIFIGMVLLVIVASILVWRYIKARRQKAPFNKSRYGDWTLNFSLRFTYEFFFEICICVVINLAAYKVDANESQLIWGMTLLLAIFVLAFTAFLISLIFRGGPYTVPNSYEKNSLKDSIVWGKRALCQENCAKRCKELDLDRPQSGKTVRTLKTDALIGSQDQEKEVGESPDLLVDTDRPLVLNEKQLASGPRPGGMQFDAMQAYIMSYDDCGKENGSELSVQADLSIRSQSQQRHSHSQKSSSFSQSQLRASRSSIQSSDLVRSVMELPIEDSSSDSGPPQCLSGADDINEPSRSKVLTSMSSFGRQSLQQTPSSSQEMSRSRRHEEYEQYEGGEDDKVEPIKIQFGQRSHDRIETLKKKGMILEEAKMRLRLQEKVKVNPAYMTLFYGLKKNHPHNMAIVHPLAFVIRRIVYALVILFFVREVAFFGVLILLFTCLVMMIFLAVESQWEDMLINRQHMVNEAIFYILCVSLLLFSGVIHESNQMTMLSWLMILLVTIMIIYNVIIIFYDTVAFSRLLYLRNRAIIQRTTLAKKLKGCNITCDFCKTKPKKTEEVVQEEKVKENQVADEEKALGVSMNSNGIMSSQSNSGSIEEESEYEKSQLTINDSLQQYLHSKLIHENQRAVPKTPTLTPITLEMVLKSRAQSEKSSDSNSYSVKDQCEAEKDLQIRLSSTCQLAVAEDEMLRSIQKKSIQETSQRTNLNRRTRNNDMRHTASETLRQVQQQQPNKQERVHLGDRSQTVFGKLPLPTQDILKRRTGSRQHKLFSGTTTPLDKAPRNNYISATEQRRLGYSTGHFKAKTPREYESLTRGEEVSIDTSVSINWQNVLRQQNVERDPSELGGDPGRNNMKSANTPRSYGGASPRNESNPQPRINFWVRKSSQNEDIDDYSHSHTMRVRNGSALGGRNADIRSSAGSGSSMIMAGLNVVNVEDERTTRSAAQQILKQIRAKRKE